LRSQTLEKTINLIDKHGAMIFLINQNNGEIIYANDAAVDFYGYPEEKLLDMNISDINTLSSEEIAAEIELARTEQKNHFDFKHRLASGEIRNIEVYSYPNNFNGTPVLFSIFNDITPRVEAEAYNKRIRIYLYISFVLIVLTLLVFSILFYRKNKKLKSTKNELEKFNKLYQTFIDANDNFIYLKDDKLNFVFVNKAIAKFFNKSKNEMIGVNDYQISGKEFADLRRSTDNMVKSEKKRIVEENIWNDSIYKTTKFPVELLDGSYGVGAFIEDVTDKVEREKQIKYLLYRDSLTGLYNRRFFEEEIKRLDTQRQLPLSIIMADVNGLKLINDSLGHEKGDELLIKTSKLLKEVVRDEDILARQGGDEFAILLPKTNNDEAQRIVLRIKEKCRKTENDEVVISIGIGIATKNESKQSINETLKEADNDMYQNKLSESRSTKSKIVQSLLNTLTAKSNETKEHALRMTKVAFDFGEKLGLSNSQQHRLSLLATLHDIGKTTIPEEILKKPGKLTEEEWVIVKNHSERGYKIASSSQEFAVVADDIYAHHERWDGSGYPRQLKGKDIPYLARIISIIEAYDVMNHERPYSKAISKKEALEEINRCAGGQFDPKLAASFIEMMKKEGKKKLNSFL
jgi:diguanylate cyclase (GGDEF)-like protein/PAS domain S-box-containing protein